MNKISNFIDEFIPKNISKKRRLLLTNELENHLLDKSNFYKEIGYPEEESIQKAIDDFIADFYCHKVRLVIELDGLQHYTPEGMYYDNMRTEVFNQHGIYVLRFSNDAVDKAFHDVCAMIDNTIKERLH